MGLVPEAWEGGYDQLHQAGRRPRSCLDQALGPALEALLQIFAHLQASRCWRSAEAQHTGRCQRALGLKCWAVAL